MNSATGIEAEIAGERNEQAHLGPVTEGSTWAHELPEAWLARRV